MEKNIKKIHCPQCASQKVKYLDDNVFECTNCKSSFFIETNETIVKHKHTYKNEPFVKTNYEQKRKLIYLISGIIIFALIFFIPTFLQKKSTNNNVNATTEEVTLGGYSFERQVSHAFIDETNSLKIFIIGTVEAINYNDEKYKNNVFWAVYDVLKGSFDQVTPFSVQGK